MDNSNRQIDHLGVNKLGKNIKKSPLHQPNFGNTAKPQPQQPQVYNINKNDFRSVVQQLTGSPARESPARPPPNHRKPLNNRLMRVRPPPLAPSRPHLPIQGPGPGPAQMQPMVPAPYANSFSRPPHPPPRTQFDQASPGMMLPPTPADVWSNTAESPISAYVRYLQNSIIDQGSLANQPHMQPQVPGPNPPQNHLHPNPHVPHVGPARNGPPPPLPSPRMNGPPPPLPSPRMNAPPLPMASPSGKGHPLNPPSPWTNGPPPLLPSPTSQFLLPSPSFFNLLSPRSSYPLLSPGYQPMPPLSPNFSFSPLGQSGILGPAPHPPPSPGYGIPLSPGFFTIPSPRWRDQ